MGPERTSEINFDKIPPHDSHAKAMLIVANFSKISRGNWFLFSREDQDYLPMTGLAEPTRSSFRGKKSGLYEKVDTIFQATDNPTRGVILQILHKVSEFYGIGSAPIVTSHIQRPEEDSIFEAEIPKKSFFGKSNWQTDNQHKFSKLGDALPQFPKAHFVFLRGAIIVSHPDRRYCLPVGPRSAGRKEHFCLVIANDHFTGGLDTCALIPSKVLQERIFKSCYTAASVKDSIYPDDLTNPGFCVESLIKDARESYVLPSLRLTNISPLFGGLSSAYPYGSEPFYSFEPDIHNVWKDGLGRVHHAYLVRRR